MATPPVLGVSSFVGKPPDPSRFKTWQDYAFALSAYTSDSSKVQEGVQPQAVQLVHIDTTGALARVVTDGLVVYDPVRRGVMVSIEGEWLPLYAGIAYGGMKSPDTPTAALNITTAWRQVTAFTDALPTLDMTFDTTTDTFSFQRPGLYLVVLQLGLDHNNAGQARELDVRIRNTITSVISHSLRVPTGSGDRTTVCSMSVQVLIEDATLNQPVLVEVSALIGDYTSVLYRGVSIQAARLNYAF